MKCQQCDKETATFPLCGDCQDQNREMMLDIVEDRAMTRRINKAMKELFE